MLIEESVWDKQLLLLGIFLFRKSAQFCFVNFEEQLLYVFAYDFCLQKRRNRLKNLLYILLNCAFRFWENGFKEMYKSALLRQCASFANNLLKWAPVFEAYGNCETHMAEWEVSDVHTKFEHHACTYNLYIMIAEKFGFLSYLIWRKPAF